MWFDGKIHPSLFNLQHLQYLDLSWNDFNGFPIPPEFGKLQRLTFLSLADAEFGGEIPPELGNITTLSHLDLSASDFGELESRKFAAWIRKLRSLEYLSMNYVNLSMASEDWGNALSSLFNLREIHLSGCAVSGTIPSLVNLTHLSHLHLSDNSFYSPLPAWFQNVSSMVSLDLSYCVLNGSIPSNFLHRSSLRNLDLSSNNFAGDLQPLVRLSSLRYLDLRGNHLSGTIPDTISELSSLTDLDLRDNHLSGTIPDTISELSSLTKLYLNNNNLSGTIPDTISELISLRYLDLSNNQLSGSIVDLRYMAHLREVGFSNNQLTLNISASWIPQFAQLQFLLLGSCNIQGEIPAFLSTQFSLEYVDLSDNNIVGNIPTWLWDLPSLDGLNLSNNRLEGSLPPAISMWVVDLHNNSLHGSIPDCKPIFLYLSENRFNGSIPRSIFSSYSLEFLDLSKNNLSGVIPTNLSLYYSPLIVLNLAQNYLEGEIPEELGNLTGLQTLNLGENRLQGVIPPSIVNCTELRVLDIGKNRIQGSIPVWIGQLAKLRILSLAFNKLQGTFQPELFMLRNLQILDLSHNNLSGDIPQSLGKLNAMTNQTQSGQIEMSLDGGGYGYADGLDGPEFRIIFVNQITLWIKGRATPYPKIISTFKFMDLSHNKLSGNIPKEMGELKGLIALNMSNNNLRGRIPESLGVMSQLESLDLSGNLLSGNIPTELVNLTFLSVLNLSFNNLSGFIPQGKQFSTFEASSYLGNLGLHGPPLENRTLRNGSGEISGQAQWNGTGVTDRDADTNEMDRWWAVSVGLCFGLGFGSVIAVLCFNLKWRYKCFGLQDSFIQYLFER